MMRRIFLLIALHISLGLFSQTDSALIKLQNFVQNINTFNHLYPQEKVYLHFDNTGYFLGENIWFKSYVVTAEANKPSPMSKVLYVELLTPEGQILETKKLKLEEGQAHGDFQLKDSLYAGFYEIRAYTKCMLNFGDDVVFSRVFPVFDKPKEEGRYIERMMSERSRKLRVTNHRNKSPKSDDINISFYPEGGNLITSLSNKVAFKITDKQGKDLDVEGMIYDSAGEEVVAFKSIHQGMGSFILYPDGNKYTAEIDYGGKKHKIDLPQSLANGYVMQVDNLNPEHLSLQISKTTDQASELIGLSITCRGKVYIFEDLKVSSDSPSSLVIPKQLLPSGVSQITLFTAHGEILAERLAFINHKKNAGRIAVSPLKSTYTPLSPITIDLELEDVQSKSLETTFSLSVRDTASTMFTGYNNNILTDFLLSSDLKGYIENPAYYFEEDDIRRRAALDLLLMTQGWRRYEWKQMAGVQPFEVKYRIEEGLVVEGKIVSVFRKKEELNMEVTMWMLTPYQKAVCMTDSLGRFNYLFDDFYGKQDLTIEVRRKNKLQHRRILLDRIYDFPVRYYTYNETHLPPRKRYDIEVKQPSKVVPAVDDTTTVVYATDFIPKTHTLSEVTITEKRKKTLKEKALEEALMIIDAQESLDETRDKAEIELVDIEEYLELRYRNMFSLEINPETGEKSFKYFNGNKKARVQFRQEGGGIGEFIGDLDMDNVQFITVSPVYSGLYGDYVYVDLFLYPDRQRRKPKIGIRKTSIQGYSNVRKFVSPDYSTALLPDEQDFRRTLYWNPSVRTDKGGKASVTFFNNSTAKSFEVSAEGITADGVLLH